MLDIVIPVYNEAGSIGKLFDEIRREIKTQKRVLIVYDFDEDTTVPAVRSLKDSCGFEVVLQRNTLGRGALNAIKCGMQTATGEMVLVMMADSSDRLDAVDKMVSLMESGFDLVCGSRYMKGGSQTGGPLLKGLFARCAGLSLHLLTGIGTHDCSNSFKLYRKSMLDAIEIESKGGFEIGLEILVKAFAQGYKIGEVPSNWSERQEGKSNFHLWKWLPSYLHWWFWCVKHAWFGGKAKR